MYTKYKKFIDQHVSMNVIEWALFRSKLSIETYKKGEIIHYAGDVATKLLFLNHGLARAYTIDENGKDHTWSIFFNDENASMINLYVVDYDSLINQEKSHISIEILEDSEMSSMSYKDMNFLYEHSKKGERFGRLMCEVGYSHLHNIFLTRQTKSAKYRFESFMNKTPYLLDLVPQYHIATLLGITPQYLSRLKQEFASEYM